MPAPPEIYIERAIAWALGQLGSRDYPAKCLAFVEDAYERGNGIVLDGYSYAREAAEGYCAAQHTGLPPQGAFVFYACSGSVQGVVQDWGHVGLALGGGQVIHAWGAVRVDDYRAIEGLTAPGWTRPQYIGWAPVEVILRGMTVDRNGSGIIGNPI